MFIEINYTASFSYLQNVYNIYQMETQEEVKGATQQDWKNRKEQTNNKNNGFECNICVSEPTEPVVTKWGHMYWWECIYKVMKIN